MSTATTATLPTPQPAAHTLLGEKLRVHLTDGRVLVGYLHCLDYKKNILLRDTVLASSQQHPEIGDAAASATATTPASTTLATSPIDVITNDKILGLVCIERQHVVKYEKGV